MSWANSAVKLMLEGCVTLRPGSRSSMLVSHWLSRFHAILSPHRVFFKGSSPIDTLLVRGFSLRYMRVPPSWKFLEKS